VSPIWRWKATTALLVAVSKKPVTVIPAPCFSFRPSWSALTAESRSPGPRMTIRRPQVDVVAIPEAVNPEDSWNDRTASTVA
jgi:hypothetical protein